LEVTEIDEVQFMRDATEFDGGHRSTGPRKHAATAGLGDCLGGTGGQNPVSNHHQRDHRSQANRDRSGDSGLSASDWAYWPGRTCATRWAVVCERYEDSRSASHCSRLTRDSCRPSDNDK
jgi:hypothetical protein